MTRLVLIFVAGGCGSLLRYGVTGWMQRLGSGTFPLGTLAVNVIGSALIGFLATLLTGPLLVRDDYRFAILVGLLGGFTTFSSFSWETVSMAGDGQWWMAALNVILCNGLGLTAAWAAARLAVAVYGP